MSSDLLLGIGVAIVVMVILSLFSLRKYRSAWTGTVLSTCHIPGDDEGGQDQYKVTVRTDEGRTLSFDVVSQAMLAEFPAGTRVQKFPRQLFPTPLRASAPPPPPPPPPPRAP